MGFNVVEKCARGGFSNQVHTTKNVTICLTDKKKVSKSFQVSLGSQVCKELGWDTKHYLIVSSGTGKDVGKIGLSLGSSKTGYSLSKSGKSSRLSIKMSIKNLPWIESLLIGNKGSVVVDYVIHQDTLIITIDTNVTEGG